MPAPAPKQRTSTRSVPAASEAQTTAIPVPVPVAGRGAAERFRSWSRCRHEPIRAEPGGAWFLVEPGAISAAADRQNATRRLCPGGVAGH